MLLQGGALRTYPKDDSSDFAGAWSVYPYFVGALAVSSIEDGLFLVKRAEPPARLRGASCMSKRLLYVPLVPSPRRDRSTAHVRPPPLFSLAGPSCWLTSRSLPFLCFRGLVITDDRPAAALARRVGRARARAALDTGHDVVDAQDERRADGVKSQSVP